MPSKKQKKPQELPGIVFKNTDKIEYHIIWKKPAKRWNASGLCDSPDTKNPEIWVDPNLDEKRFLEVLIEEVTHAHWFDKTEKDVRKFTANLRRILWKVYKISLK